jgi:hypothetical protein
MKNFKISFGKSNMRSSGRLFSFGTSPEADWKVIFVSALILGVLIILLSVFIFIKIDKGEIFVVKQSTNENSKTLDITLLKETVSHYQSKAREFEQLKNTVIPAVDPSL